jgi:acetyl esterase
MPDRPLRLSDRIERFAARVLVRLPGHLHVRLSGEPPVTADGLTLDPHVQLVRVLRRKRNPHHLCEPTLEQGRARYRREALLFRGPMTQVGAVRDFTIPGDGGPLRVRHYAPAADGPRPLTVYLHGGGFTIGDLDTHDEACRILCRYGEMHVLAVEYRLAPEHPFPAALDDTRAALRWAQAHAAELGADPARVAIGGDSAGANLAAVVSIETRGDRPPAAQLLIYPVVDRQNTRLSQQLFGEGYFLSNADRAAFTHNYLHGTGVGERDWRVSPLYAEDLSGLAPALVVTAGFDMLRDEGEAYADALQAAGSTARLTRVDAHGHGFLHMTGVSPGARQALVQTAKDWRALLGPHPLA